MILLYYLHFFKLKFNYSNTRIIKKSIYLMIKRIDKAIIIIITSTINNNNNDNKLIKQNNKKQY